MPAGCRHRLPPGGHCPQPCALLGLCSVGLRPLLRVTLTEHKGALHLSLCLRAKKHTFLRLFLEDAKEENNCP